MDTLKLLMPYIIVAVLSPIIIPLAIIYLAIGSLGNAFWWLMVKFD